MGATSGALNQIALTVRSPMVRANPMPPAKCGSMGCRPEHDANNIYSYHIFLETQNMTVFGNNHIANKAQNFLKQ